MGNRAWEGRTAYVETYGHRFMLTCSAPEIGVVHMAQYSSRRRVAELGIRWLAYGEAPPAPWWSTPFFARHRSR